MKSKDKGVGLHPRNIHQGRYDLAALVETLPELSQIVFDNDYGQQSLDFANPIAVKLLNNLMEHGTSLAQSVTSPQEMRISMTT